MNDVLVSQLIEGFAALGGVAGAASFFKLGAQRRQMRARTESDAVRTATSLLPAMREQTDYWTTQAAVEREHSRSLRAEVEWLREYVRQLVETIRRLGAEPPPPPAVPVPEGPFESPDSPHSRLWAPRKDPS